MADDFMLCYVLYGGKHQNFYQMFPGPAVKLTMCSNTCRIYLMIYLLGFLPCLLVYFLNCWFAQIADDFTDDDVICKEEDLADDFTDYDLIDKVT